MSGNPEKLPPLLIRASAGTGKTYQLTGRLLRILLTGASPDTILATTFTRKAAGEILNRLLKTLAHAATDESELEKLRGQIELDHLHPSVPAPLLRKTLQSIHKLRICTLDSLFSQLARSFAFELQLPPGWQLTDEVEEAWLTDHAIGRMLQQFDHEQIQTLFHMLSKGEAERNVARRLLTVVNNNFIGYRRANRDAWTQLSLPTPPPAAEITQAIGLLAESEVGHKTATKQIRAISEQALSGRMRYFIRSYLLISTLLSMDV